MAAAHDDIARSASDTELQGMVKPATDKLKYKMIVLENELKVLLINDADADKAAAAMDVRAGSLMDPPELQGLAHFTEHMLFYSSEKYPVEDEYSKFLSTHGGHTNAFTASEDTNYQFDVNWDHLEAALDRFAQFFICPLISADGVEREIKAVDSEHSKNINTDSWRKLQLFKHLSNPKHPWSKFSTGNLQTLWDEPREAGLDVRQAVVDFYTQHYSSNLMRLVVIGRHSLPELERMVKDKFSAIKNKQLPVPEIPKGVFLREHVGKLLKVVPQKQGHVLDIVWEVPASLPLYRSAPLNYISHFVGHEGTGSVFSVLKSFGWVTSLSAGEGGNSFSSCSFFSIKIELTDLGHAHVQDIIAHIYRYLAILNGPDGISKSCWQEMRDLQHLRFTFREKQSPYNYATNLSWSMQLYDDADLLLAMNNVPFEFNAEAIKEALDVMTPDKMRVYWASKTWEGKVDLKEPWYGTEFSVEDLPEEWMAEWNGVTPDERLHLPEPNPFISTDFTLIPQAPPQAPAVAWESSLTRLYHKPDTSFEVPKACIYLDFQLPEAQTSPEAAVLTRLLTDLVVDALTELAYPAELAGLYYDVQNLLTGIQVVAAGYNHKVVTLLEAILDTVLNHKVDADRFKVIAEKLAKDYNNMQYQQPYQWAMYKKGVALNLRKWSVEELKEILPQLTPDHLSSFLPRLFARCRVDGLVVGNMKAEDATSLGQHVDKLLAGGLYPSAPAFPSQAKDLRVLKLPQGKTAIYKENGPNPANDNSASMEVYQVGLDDLPTNALVDVLVQFGKRDAFHQLRTVEQLGYIVFMFATSDQAVQNLAFLIQSNSYGAGHCSDRVAAFLPKLKATLQGLTDEELEKAKEETAKARLEKPKNLNELTSRTWSEIYYGTFIFDRHAREAAHIRTITKQQLTEFADRVLFNPATRRKLTVHIFGSAEMTRVTAAANTTAPAPAAETDATAPVTAASLDTTASAAPADAAITTPATPADTETDAAVSAADTDATTSGADTTAADTDTAAPVPAATEGAGAVGPDQCAAAEATADAVPEEFVEITDLWAFKRSCEAYPSIANPGL